MKFQRQRREEININLTPLIDVVFLLLIFFMISTTFTREAHLTISLPEASAEGEAQQQTGSIDVVVGAEGQYTINGESLVSSDALTLRRALLKLAGEARDVPFIITADAQAAHQSVVTVMDVAGKLGFSKLSITTQKTSAD
ncbi:MULTISPECIES: biopolymer transporter ExbD [Marinobacterium]|uniref:Biopolymer transport protein ExbD n=1 Tax=Marinobacterium iners DSM 11526 TaxID=1122198 RepID=A0A1H4B715_9GAMM|nr:biopolymer transporter ExbD [Marinobacterium iners]SEA43834.1 biopolymer transport protein ExbD [Marinobacterium iners DSM 11526]